VNSILIWLIAAVMGFGGVAQAKASEESAAPATTPVVAAEEPSRSVEQRFAQREMLPPCGMIGISHPAHGVRGDRLSPPRQAWGCLQGAVGFGGELVTLDQHRNGASVNTYYRATRDGRLEIWTQRTRSSPGRPASRWAYEECTPADDMRLGPCAS
jgi:hypothetical protein